MVFFDQVLGNIIPTLIIIFWFSIVSILVNKETAEYFGMRCNHKIRMMLIVYFTLNIGILLDMAFKHELI